MFSNHLRKVDHKSGKTLLLIAGGLLIVCQLVAMVLVTQGQVEKAQVREASQASERTAIAWCVETSRGVEIRSCAAPSSGYSAQTSDRALVMSTSRD